MNLQIYTIFVEKKKMSLFSDFYYLFYPRLCLFCKSSLLKNEHVICSDCLIALPRTYYEIEKNNPIEKRFWGRIHLENACAYLFFTKKGIVQALMHGFKYNKKKEIGQMLGATFGKVLVNNENYQDIDIVIPVPIHAKKVKKRGYNQSEILAHAIALNMNKKMITNVLTKQKATETQTRKTRFLRWENVKDVFTLQNTEQLRHKHVLLVDDVITTGATLESCARLLLSIEGVRISIASLATPQN